MAKEPFDRDDDLSPELNERAVKAAITRSYYYFLRNADLAEFTEIVDALELQHAHVKPYTFKLGVKPRLDDLITICFQHKEFLPFFVKYFAHSVHRWL